MIGTFGKIGEQQKQEWWDFWTHDEQKEYRPHGMTPTRMKKLKPVIWNDHNFWFHSVIRFGMEAEKPRVMRERDKFKFDAATGNFFAMLREKMR